MVGYFLIVFVIKEIDGISWTFKIKLWTLSHAPKAM